MQKLLRACLLSICALAAGDAYADCTVSADPGATVRAVNPTAEADAQLIVSMSMMPKLMHIDYAAAAKRATCDIGPIAVGDARYEMWGDDKTARIRKALPATKNDPIAIVIPVVDMVAALEAAKAGKTAPNAGYLLATISTSDLTGWRFYTAMPDAAVLRHDMAEVLSGRGSPIFRNQSDGKTALFVPKG